jgi:sec-independent protein translocase protein TatA
MGSSILTPTHLIFLLLIALLLFGAKRLPEIGRSLGTGMREFKDSVTANGPEKVETRSELPPPVAAPPVVSAPVAAAPVPAAPPAPPETAVPAPPAAADPEREAEPVS